MRPSRTFLFVIFVLTLFLDFDVAQARHVSFLGGTSLMGTNRSEWSDLMASHTSFPWFAEGLDYRTYRDQSIKREFAFATGSFLPIRWNEDSAQTNLYVIAGGGVGKQNRVLTGSSLGAIEFDRETRRTFASLYAEAIGVGTSEIFQLQRMTAGFAPYLADMDGLHTWILLQIESESRNVVTDVTPLLRITYNNALFEFGSSLNGNWQFDWIVEI